MGSKDNNIQNVNAPYVSVIIPMRNEEQHIENCIDSIFRNDYPDDRLEVLVVDGRSDDDSKNIVEKFVSNRKNVRILDNPKRIIPTALNIGIQEAQGDVIIRMDAHSIYDEKFISKCVNLLESKGAANVGGVLEAVGKNYIGNAIAIATTNPFGVGDALYRYGDKERWVDTVFPGAWYKKTFEAIGGFNEEMVVNQDYELNYRLREAGGKILLSPDIRCRYFVRSSIFALMRQYFRYGYWKVKTLVLHPDSLRWRQIVAPLFVLGLLVSILLIPVSVTAALIIPGLYVIFNIFASTTAVARRGFRYLPVIPFLFLIIHLSWGLGFLGGIMKFGFPKFTVRSIRNALRKIF